MFRIPQGSRPFAVLAGLAFISAASCSRASTAPRAPSKEAEAKPVQVERVRQESVRRTIEVVGTLAAEDEVTISAEAEGRVSRIVADLGDRVVAGQALVELDREKSQYSVDQQTASFARALAKFGANDVDHLPPIEDTPDVQKAFAELDQAKQAQKRAEELGRRELLPKQAIDDADSMLRSKQASYNSALQTAKDLRADIDASTASMRLAQRQLRDSSIRAPFDGYVQKRLVSLGEYVKMQSPVISVVRMDPLKVTAEIPEKMAPWVSLGQAVDLRVDAYPDLAVTGKVSRISPAVNTTTRAFSFEARVPNEKALLKPGTFARVHIDSDKVDQVLTLPFTALQYRYGVNRVFVVMADKDGDHLAAREVKIGDRLGDRIEIGGGLNANEAVVATDVEKLVDGAKVSAHTSGS